MFPFPFLGLTLRWDNLAISPHCTLALKTTLALDCSSFSASRPTFNTYPWKNLVVHHSCAKPKVLFVSFRSCIYDRMIRMEHFWNTGLIALVFSSLVSSEQKYILKTPDCSTCVWYWNTAAYAPFSGLVGTVCFRYHLSGLHYYLRMILN